MKISIIKYHSTIGGLTLLSYLIIFLINIFHFHNLELDTNHIFDLANDTNLQGQSIKSEFQCIIHQNFNSLHLFTLHKPTANKLYLACQFVTELCSDQKQLNNLFYSSNQLRAPPSFF